MPAAWWVPLEDEQAAPDAEITFTGQAVLYTLRVCIQPGRPARGHLVLRCYEDATVTLAWEDL